MTADIAGTAVRTSRVTRGVIYAALLFFAFYYMLPLYVMVVNSVKPLEEIRGGNMLALPQQFTFASWLSAWSTAQIGVQPTGLQPYFLNSILIVVPAVAVSTILGALNGYVLTKWRFPGANIVFGMMLLACFIPFQIVLIPMARILGLLGLAGTIYGLILVHVVYGLGFTTLFFRNYYEAFPTELAVHQCLERLSLRRLLRRLRFDAHHRGAEQSGELLHRGEGIQRPFRRRADGGAADPHRLYRFRPLFRARAHGRRGQGVKMAFLEIEGLTKRYGATEVLKGIDLEIEEGGFLVLVGPSGCGKSTLLNTIAGLETVTGGEIRIAGRRVNELHPSKRDIAMVFQSYALYPNMTVAGNIAFGMEMRGVAKPERDAAIARVSEVLQIGHLLDRRPSQLSGGQRQRVAMGRALVRNPQVFLFDEPLSNLDAKLRIDMRTEIKRLHQAMGTTIVYVTLDQIEAMTLATRIAVLKDGVLQQFGTPAEIYNEPVNVFVADFMGSPAMNLVPAKGRQEGSRSLIALTRADEPDLLLGLSGPSMRIATESRDVLIGIRPEAITDADGADRNSKHIVEAECLVEVVEPAGADTYVVTRLGGREVIARMRSDARILPGERVPFAFNMEKAVFFDPVSEARVA